MQPCHLTHPPLLRSKKAPMRLSHGRKNSESYCRRHFHDCGGQSEMKRRASSVVGCGPQTATMRFHDGTADRQPHAAALRFRGEEGIEDLVRSSGGQSYSGVADGDQHFTALAWSRLDREHSAGLLHRLDTIEHEVHQHLLQLHTV